MVISVGNRKFSRSRMTKQTSPLNSETIRISRFSRHRMSGDTWHDHVDATWNLGRWTRGMMVMWCSK